MGPARKRQRVEGAHVDDRSELHKRRARTSLSRIVTGMLPPFATSSTGRVAVQDKVTLHSIWHTFNTNPPPIASSPHHTALADVLPSSRVSRFLGQTPVDALIAPVDALIATECVSEHWLDSQIKTLNHLKAEPVISWNNYLKQKRRETIHFHKGMVAVAIYSPT